MILRWYCRQRALQGFSLVEIMIAVAIIGILAVVALPNYTAYRNKTVVAAAVGTAGNIRASLASYASNHSEARFPLTADIVGWEALRTIVNTHGGTLKSTAAEMGIEAINYISEDGTAYLLQLIVHVPHSMLGRTVSVTPGSIAKE